MIRKLLFLLLVLFICFACSDDEKVGFDVPVEFQKISFEPVPGGAVMRYILPDNLEIFGVRARYKDAYGRQQVKDGTYLTDSLLLSGFNEAKVNERVQLTFFNSNLVESESLEMTFNTQDAATVALFDNLTVNPFWGGFNVTYSSPATVEGTIHIFYIGVNPATQQLDSILMGSYPIVEGGDTLNFELKQTLDQLNVVIRTDDFDGNRVKLKVYENIPALAMELLSPEKFEFYCTDNDLIKEEEKYGFSKKYLFDGTKKGDLYRKNKQKGISNKYDTFIAGPMAFGERFIFDFGEPRIPAILNAYAFLNHGYDYPYPDAAPGQQIDYYIANVWHGTYTSRLACKLTVYGTNEDPRTVALSSCARLYSLDDSPLWANFYSNAWCKNSDYVSGPATIKWKDKSDADFDAADPIVLKMSCNYTGEAFRYVFFVVEDTYCSHRWQNTYPLGFEDNFDEYVTFDEIEVFVKKTE